MAMFVQKIKILECLSSRPVYLISPDKVLSILFLLQLRIDLLLTSLMMREALWWSLTKLFDEGAEGVTQYD